MRILFIVLLISMHLFIQNVSAEKSEEPVFIAETPDLMEESGEVDKTELEVPYTKEEMVEVIHRRLKIFSEIAYMINNLVAQENEEGGTDYFYVDEFNNQFSLSDLDKKTLHLLFVRVNNEATRLNTERLMKQLQQQHNLIRNMQQQQQIIQQQAALTAQIQAINNNIPRQPVIHQQPQVYTPPQAANHQPPKVYQPPKPPQIPNNTR